MAPADGHNNNTEQGQCTHDIYIAACKNRGNDASNDGRVALAIGTLLFLGKPGTKFFSLAWARGDDAFGLAFALLVPEVISICALPPDIRGDVISDSRKESKSYGSPVSRG